jgi:hypothetical protein
MIPRSPVTKDGPGPTRTEKVILGTDERLSELIRRRTLIDADARDIRGAMREDPAVKNYLDSLRKCGEEKRVTVSKIVEEVNHAGQIEMDLEAEAATKEGDSDDE